MTRSSERTSLREIGWMGTEEELPQALGTRGLVVRAVWTGTGTGGEGGTWLMGLVEGVIERTGDGSPYGVYQSGPAARDDEEALGGVEGEGWKQKDGVNGMDRHVLSDG